jgi:hypothetical protein
MVNTTTRRDSVALASAAFLESKPSVVGDATAQAAKPSIKLIINYNI